MSVISDSKYIISGVIIVFFTIFLIIIFVNQLKYPVQNTQSYILDKCKINSIIFKTVEFDCWQYGFVTVIEIPCVQVIVNTKNLNDIFLYRNYLEKDFTKTNNFNVRLVTRMFPRILNKTINF